MLIVLLVSARHERCGHSRGTKSLISYIGDKETNSIHWDPEYLVQPTYDLGGGIGLKEAILAETN